MKTMVALILVLWATILAGEARASGLLIGPLWFEGVQDHEDPNDHIDRPDGRWIHVSYRLQQGGVRKTLAVFNAPVSFDGVPNTKRVFAKAAQDGIKVIAAGTLRDVHIDGYRLDAAGGRQLWIEPNDFRVDLGHVTSGLQQIAGGTMDLAGSQLWIKNLTVFRTRSDSLEGSFELTTWNRKLAKARIMLAGGAEGTGTFTPTADQQNVVLHVDMSSGAASLWQASLAAEKMDFSGAGLEVGPGLLRQPQLQVGRVLLNVTGGALNASLSSAQGKADGIELRNGAMIFVAGAATFGWASAQAPGLHSNSEANVHALAVEGARLTTSRATLRRADRLLLGGALTASQVTLSLSAFTGNFNWSHPDVPPLAFLLPQGAVSQAALRLYGAWDDTFRLAGSLDADSLLAGSMRFLRPLHLEIPETLASEELTLPIAIDEPARMGSVEISDLTPVVTLTGELRRLFLKATCTLVLSDLEKSRLRVLPEDLKVEIAGAIATTPWLGSTKPLFGSAMLSGRNPTVLNVSAAERSGVVLITAGAVALGDPILRFGDTNPFRARIDLKTTAEATFAHCLNRGDLQLVKGTLAADGAFTALDSGAMVEMGGMVLTNPAGSIQSLVFSVDRLAGQGSLSSGLISLGGTRVARPRDPKRPNDLAFEGTLQRPMLIGSLQGTPVFTADGIELTNLQTQRVGVALANATFELSQAITLKEASLSLHGDRITSSLELPETDSDTPSPVPPSSLKFTSFEGICRPPASAEGPHYVRREYFDHVQVDASGKLAVKGDIGNHQELELVNAPLVTGAHLEVSGRTDRLSGGGGADFGGFAGTLHFAIETNANCAGGQMLRIPMNSALATGGSRLAITLERGETVVKGSLAGFGLAMVSTAMAECHSDWRKEVLVAATSGWTDGICPTWSDPFRHCRWSWSTPEVSYEYRSKAVVRGLTASVFMTNPRIEMAKKKTLICNVGPANIVPAAIEGGYYPEFRGSVPVVSDIANALVGTTAEVAETGIASVFNAVAGIVGEGLSSPLGPAACLLMGL
jgi:hypothetical protein